MRDKENGSWMVEAASPGDPDPARADLVAQAMERISDIRQLELEPALRQAMEPWLAELEFLLVWLGRPL